MTPRTGRRALVALGVALWLSLAAVLALSEGCPEWRLDRDGAPTTYHGCPQ